MTRTLPGLAGASELTTVHGLGGVVGDALDRITEWHTTADALTKLHELPTITNPGDGRDELTSVLLDTLTTGTEVDLLTEADNLVRRGESARLLAIARQSARGILAADLDEAVRSNWAALFEALAAEFADILAGVRSLTRLNQLGSADAAIAADRVEDWQKWQALLARHAQCRQQQMILMRHSGIVTAFPQISYIRSSEKVFADWALWHRDGALHDPDRPGHVVALSPPWPATNDHKVTAGIAGSEEFLRWALNADAELWLPTPTQMKAETARLTALVDATNRPLTPAGRN